MSDEQVLKILNEFSNVFHENDVFSQAFRGIGWVFINLLSTISTKLEEVNDKVYTMIDFFNYKGITELLDKFKPVIWVILFVSIMYLAYQFVINRRYQADNLFMNIIMAVMVIMLVPSLMGQVSKITTNGVKAVNNEYTSTANEIVKSYVVDLYYLDKDNFSSKDAKNRISKDRINTIDINETIETNETENKDVFENKIKTDENGEQKITKLGKSFGFIQSKYFRYHFDFLPIVISTGCITITQLFVSLKVAKLIFELGFGKLFAMFYAFGDIASGQRIKNIVQHTFTIFAVIFSTSLSLKLYTIYTNWVSTVADTNMVVQMIFLIAGAWAVIDGPDIVERALGIDAGVKSSGGVIAAGISGGKIAGDMINGAKNMISSASCVSLGSEKQGSIEESQTNKNSIKDIDKATGDDNVDSNNAMILDKDNEDSNQSEENALSDIEENEFEIEPLDHLDTDSDGELDLDEIKKNINDDLEVSNADVANANLPDIENANMPENQISPDNLSEDPNTLDNSNLDDINSISNMPSEPEIDLSTDAPLQDRIDEFDNQANLYGDNPDNLLEYGLDDEFKNYDNKLPERSDKNEYTTPKRDNISGNSSINDQNKEVNSITNNFNSNKNNVFNSSYKDKRNDININTKNENNEL